MSGGQERALALRSQDVMPRRLDVLAATAREQHGLVVQSLRRTLEHIVACGEALIEARELIPSGHWQAWLGENVGIHRTTAQLYVRVAQFREELDLVGVSSISEAQAYLRANRLVLEIARRPVSEGVVAEIQSLAEQGLSHHKIAVRVGVSRQTVSRRLKRKRSRQAALPVEVLEERRPALTEITDEMIEGMARWLAARGQMPLTDRSRLLATEALRVSLNYRRAHDITHGKADRQ